jgi:hypothetical protein
MAQRIIMFSHSEALNRAVGPVLEYAAGLDRGDVLRLTDIERLSGCDRYTGNWNAIVSKIKKTIFRDRGIALRPLNGVGYAFCTNTEQVQWCFENRSRRQLRQACRGAAELNAVRTDNLHLQIQRARNLDEMKRLRREVKRSRRFSRQTRTETMPIPRQHATA